MSRILYECEKYNYIEHEEHRDNEQLSYTECRIRHAHFMSGTRSPIELAALCKTIVIIRWDDTESAVSSK